MELYTPTRATKSQLTRFHSDEYIDFLEAVTPETADEMTGGGTRCLTGEDCPAFEGVFEFCTISAGGSIGACERLNEGTADVAINWAGGLHHAKKTEASGFCYVNDIVLGILELLRKHQRVLYIDTDIHHGDGVEEAFYSTDRVMTCSFHKFGDYFPGTGDVKDIGIKNGKNYAVNIPLRDGINDESYHSIFKPVIQHIMDWYRPGAVVLQCGADSLAGDKLGCFNLSMEGHSQCARFVKSFNLPTMMVGGGGYTTKNVSREWTKETSIMCGVELDENLPWNVYMEYYGPRYKLEVLANNMDDQNTPEYLASIRSRVIDNLRAMPFAPSVQMQQVPGVSVGQATGIISMDHSADEDADYNYDSRVQEIWKNRQASDETEEDDPDSDVDMEAVRSTSINPSSRRKQQSAFGKPTGTFGGSARGKGGKHRHDVLSKHSAAAAAAATGDLAGAFAAGSGSRQRRRFFKTDSPLDIVMEAGKVYINGKSAAARSGIIANGEDYGLNAIGARSRYGSPMSVA